MMSDKTPQIQLVSWDEVAPSIKNVLPELHDTINNMPLARELRLYRLRYPYGSMIIDKNAVFNVPHNGQLLPITHPDVPQQIREDLSYNWNSIPLSIMTKNKVELFMENSDGSLETSAIYAKGVAVGLRGVLDPPQSYQSRSIWRMTAGSRSPIMVPGISNRLQFDKLRRKYGIRTNKPESQSDHWFLFKELANNELFKTPWFAEFIAFPHQWLEPRQRDDWKLFHRELLLLGWRASAYPRNSRSVERIWNNFTNSLRNKRATPYVLTILRHIIDVALGQAPGFVVYPGHNEYGPFDEIIQILLDVYGLKKYTPIIVNHDNFKLQSMDECYISMKYLTTPWKGEDASANAFSLINHQREIKLLLEQFIEQIATEKIQVADTPFSQLTKLNYDFYHYTKDERQGVMSSTAAFKDSALVKQLQARYGLHTIPNTPKNLFLSGLVKISKKAIIAS